jgi:transcriptional regulator with XRE-family HTH domain
MSQEVLARRVGVSFQQLQKYERGANRVSASKLFEIADALKVDVAVMFEGLRSGAEPSDNPMILRIAADEELRRLIALYERLSTSEDRRRLVRALEIVAAP